MGPTGTGDNPIIPEEGDFVKNLHRRDAEAAGFV